jgi:hypothetical protein
MQSNYADNRSPCVFSESIALALRCLHCRYYVCLWVHTGRGATLDRFLGSATEW